MANELIDTQYTISCRDGRDFWLTARNEILPHGRIRTSMQDCIDVLPDPSVHRKIASAMMRARSAVKLSLEMWQSRPSKLTSTGRLYHSLKAAYFPGSPDRTVVDQVLRRTLEGLCSNKTRIVLRGATRCVGEGAVGISDEGYARLPRQMQRELHDSYHVRITQQVLNRLNQERLPRDVMYLLEQLPQQRMRESELLQEFQQAFAGEGGQVGGMEIGYGRGVCLGLACRSRDRPPGSRGPRALRRPATSAWQKGTPAAVCSRRNHVGCWAACV